MCTRCLASQCLARCADLDVKCLLGRSPLKCMHCMHPRWFALQDYLLCQLDTALVMKSLQGSTHLLDKAACDLPHQHETLSNNAHKTSTAAIPGACVELDTATTTDEFDPTASQPNKCSASCLKSSQPKCRSAISAEWLGQ